jgi:hypothetical protein
MLCVDQTKAFSTVSSSRGNLMTWGQKVNMAPGHIYFVCQDHQAEGKEADPNLPGRRGLEK